MRFIIVVALCLWSAASAQETVSAKLVSKDFIENYDPEVSVSGNVIVGIMTAAAATAILDDEVAISAPAVPVDPELCLKAASRDGIYTSRNAYALPERTSGRIHLPYDSSFESVVENYAEHDIALGATVGDCDSGGLDYYLLGGAAIADAASAVMYLNSFGATDVFVAVGDNEGEACDYISEGRRTTFDFVCTLPVRAGDNEVAITVFRERFGREQPSISIRLHGATQ